ncbi:UDP-N-acetylmuramoyl-L-alanine--D-glutamate ligase [Alicyclobacillus tolerans]|uniref:UDP-N-acetylmuramoyl-L-alanine--D-glutamate ligase n=1 Tax=Alicyclobacillus tolerans TaxID=90970 RepID=UPI003B7A945B
METSQNKRSQPKVLVLGMARSGAAVAGLLLNNGYDVTLNEKKSREECGSIVQELEDRGCRVVCGDHPLSLLDNDYDFIVKNPGIPYHVPIVAEAERRSIPIYTDIEVASWYIQSPIVAVTGSNGKTTTTSLIGEMLSQAGLQPVVAGNIGIPVASVVDTVCPQQPLVLEVSSFQLLGTERFHPHVAVFLNLYSAHLDYHGTREAYAAAKWKLFSNLDANDVAILNFDQPELRAGAVRLAAKIFPFSRLPLAQDGVYLDHGVICIRKEGQVTQVIPEDDILLPGLHNRENALAAIAAAAQFGVTPTVMASVLRSFRGVEHRLEWVRDVSGVHYYNDSKSTNPQAAKASLMAFQSMGKSVVWIAGGLERMDDFSPLQPFLQGTVRMAVIYGECGQRLYDFLHEHQIDCNLVENLEQALETAATHAKPGEVVLLSPAAASWDMFSSFEERGSMFKELVHKL